VDQAIEAGATNIERVAFEVVDPTALESRARSLAMTEARARAEELASLAGVTVNGVMSIIEGEMEPASRAFIGRAASSETTPIEAGETEVRVSVRVSYSIS
jgi:uncharacterized protein YggE